MTSDRLEELIALAALGELNPEETRELDDLLLAEPDGPGELRATLDAAAAVQATVSEQPPAPLRERVLAAIADLPQEPPAPPARFAAPNVVAPNPVAPNVVSLEARRRRRIGPYFAAAAAAVVLTIGGTVVLTSDRGGGDPIAEVVDASDVTVRTFDGQLGDLQMYYSPSEQALVVVGVATRLPADDNTLELWLVAEDGATPVGLFVPDDDGTVEARFDGVDPTGFVLGITEEPSGGSETPTLPILASA